MEKQNFEDEPINKNPVGLSQVTFQAMQLVLLECLSFLIFVIKKCSNSDAKLK
jgi:hypothetical protein